MNPTDTSPDYWQLLNYIHPIFACELPFINSLTNDDSTREILHNYEALFEFELWLVPCTIQEIQAKKMSEIASQEAAVAVMSLLGLFERYVHKKVFNLYFGSDSGHKSSSNQVSNYVIIKGFISTDLIV
jgi:hypothetical protein